MVNLLKIQTFFQIFFLLIFKSTYTNNIDQYYSLNIDLNLLKEFSKAVELPKEKQKLDYLEAKKLLNIITERGYGPSINLKQKSVILSKLFDSLEENSNKVVNSNSNPDDIIDNLNKLKDLFSDFKQEIFAVKPKAISKYVIEAEIINKQNSNNILKLLKELENLSFEQQKSNIKSEKPLDYLTINILLDSFSNLELEYLVERKSINNLAINLLRIQNGIINEENDYIDKTKRKLKTNIDINELINTFKKFENLLQKIYSSQIGEKLSKELSISLNALLDPIYKARKVLEK